MSEQLVAEVASIPTITSGSFLIGGAGAAFEVNLAVKKYSGEVTAKGAVTWKPGDAMNVYEASADVKFKVLSRSGRHFVLGREVRGVGAQAAPKRVVEVWRDGRYGGVVLDVSKVHKDFCVNDTLSGFSWSPSDRYFVYVAEDAEGEAPAAARFKLAECFGEKLQNFTKLVLVVVDVDGGRVRKLALNFAPVAGVASVQPCQPVFLSDDCVVFTGIHVGSQLLGMTYIFVRDSAIYMTGIDGAGPCTQISPSRVSCRSPITSRDGRAVVYLQNPIGRSHFQCSALVHYDTVERRTTELVPIVQVPGSKSAFPGLFLTRLPGQYFDDRLFLASAIFSEKALFVVSIAERAIQPLLIPVDAEHGSWRILDVSTEGVLLLCFSTMTHPGSVYTYSCLDQRVQRHQIPLIEAHPLVIKLRSTSDTELLHLHEHCEAVVLKPKRDASVSAGADCPLILMPHGGPNSVYSFEFMTHVAMFLLTGCVVASVNYTGSVGFGQAAIAALEGHIGDRDVEDCRKIVAKLVDGDYGLDRSKIVLCGGSHGGYISAFLSGRYASTFAGAILRNPVIDLPSMTWTTDITDWTFGQLGLDFDPLRHRIWSEAELALMRSKSPSACAHQASVPTLLLLGGCDLRVSPSQGRLWANLLKANGTRCDTYVFPDANHSLETPDSDRFSMLLMLDFLKSLNILTCARITNYSN